MIKKQEPLSLAETKKLLGKIDPDNQTLRIKKTLDYLKKFSKVKPEKSSEVIKKLSESGITKLNKQHLVKIADVMPESPIELRGIFFGDEVNLDTNETEKILQIIKEIK